MARIAIKGPGMISYNRTPGCKCSDYQLEQVGCACEILDVHVWPRGYADDAGPQVLVITADANAQNEAARAFGPMAKVFKVRERYPMPKPSVSNEAAQAYTRNDNS